jgi:hypothetical protein
MGSNPVRHIDDPYVITEQVLFVGTASTSFSAGIWLCYNIDYGTATTTEGSRRNRVEVPSITNAHQSAGASLHDFKTDADGNAKVQIAKPGSTCLVKASEDTVIGRKLTAFCGAGNDSSRFTALGFSGRGTATMLETNTTLLEDNRAPAFGADALAADGLTITVTDSSDYTAGTDKVQIFCGQNDATGVVVAGIYDFTITDGTTIVLTASCVDTTPAGALNLSFVVIDGDNDMVLAHLDDGEESGLVYYRAPADAGGTVTNYNPYGKNYIMAVTIAAADDITFAQGTFFGQHCGFFLLSSHETSDTVVNLATNGFTMTGGALAEVNTIDTTADYCYFDWRTVWRTSHTNTTEA